MATDPSLLSQWYREYLTKPPKVETYQPTSAGASTWGVNKDTDTVQGQLKGILKSGGPLMEQAATAGAQGANRKGLLNSSMGVQAGQAALYDKAIPIATADANIYADAGKTNAQLGTQVNIANAGYANDAGRFNAGSKNDMSGLLFKTAADYGLEDKRQVFEAGEASADRAFRTGERLSGQDFAAEQKTLDREFTSSERLEVQKFEDQRLLVQNDFTARMQAMQESGMNTRQAQQLATQEALAKLSEAGVQNRFDAQQALQSDQFSFEQAAIDRRMVQQHEQRLKEMGYAAELDVNNVPSNFAASVSSNTMNAVNAIAGDPNLDAAAKQNAIQNVIENGNATLRWAATTYKTAFPPIPGFGEPAKPVFNVPGQPANYPQNPNAAVQPAEQLP